MLRLIKLNLPEASGQISITVPKVREGPDVFSESQLCMWAYEHMHTYTYKPRPTTAVQKPKGRENLSWVSWIPRGNLCPCHSWDNFFLSIPRKYYKLWALSWFVPQSQMEKTTRSTRLITFVTVIIQESDIESLPVKELLLETVSVQ